MAQDWAARDPRFKVISQENRGVSAARNRGVAEARGDWLLFLDSDDTLHRHALRRLLAASRAGAEVVVGRGIMAGDAWAPPARDLSRPFEVLASHCAFYIHSALVRRARVLEVGGFDEGLKTNEDWDLWQRIARTGARFRQIKAVVGVYWRRPDSLSMGAQQMAADLLEVLRRGHAPDPRVASPAPAFANGAPREELRGRRLTMGLWFGAQDIARGGDGAWLTGLVDPAEFAGMTLDPDRLGLVMVDGLANGLARPPEQLSGEWPRVGRRARRFLHLILPAPETARQRDVILLTLKDRLDGRFDIADADETTTIAQFALDIATPLAPPAPVGGRGLAIQVRNEGKPLGLIFAPASANTAGSAVAALVSAGVKDFAMGRVSRALRPWRYPAFWLGVAAGALQILRRPGSLRQAGRLAFARGAQRVVEAKLRR